MASCDVQATASEEELKTTENNKNVKNSEESRPIPMHVDSDAAVHSSSEGELRPRSSVTKTTRIPAPVFMRPSSSNRIYNSVVVQHKNRSSLENQPRADDSGINLECSMAELQTSLSARPSPMLQPMLDNIPAISSEMELLIAEEKTLRELQRVVAEMEADVELHNSDMQKLQPRDDVQDTQLHNEATDVGNGAERLVLDMEQPTENETMQETLPSEPENRLVYEKLPAENVQMVHEEIAQKEEFSEIKETAVEIESIKEFELFEQLADEPLEEYTEIVQEAPQDAEGGESEKYVPESVMGELEMVLGGSCESEQDRLIREQFEKSVETSDPIFHQPTDEIVCIDTEPEVDTIPMRSGSVESVNGMVALEESKKFDPKRNLEQLWQLMQTITEKAEAAPDLTEAESEQSEKKEMEAEVEVGTDIEEEMDPDLRQFGKPLTFLRRLIGHRILKFSYPILFCSLAFSLIYISRKE